ncbi:MAG: GAF domain-containing protein [Bacteroidaceae bacterium]|nr:GAF domain-containing protein [Bacteroidaceae bacterium]
MSENLIIDNNASKEDKYVTLLPQIEAVIDGEPDIIANMANIASMIQETFQFWWTGFYRVIDNQLVLGPFQGPMACTRIKFGKGVCGTAWKEAQTIIVKDVDQFPGHIACSSASRSEIVVPLKVNGEVVGVLDIDSEKLSNFDSTDQKWLEKVAVLLSAVYKS